MKLENQVVNKDISQEIKELGFERESLYSYGKYLKREGFGLDTWDFEANPTENFETCFDKSLRKEF